MTDQLETARAALNEARDRYTELRKTNPSGDTPSHSDCAALHERAALAYRVAGALYQMAMFDEAAAAAGEGDILAAVADACSQASG